MNSLQFRGEFHAKYTNPDGTPGWEEVLANSPTLQGLTDNLACYFNGGPQRSWNVGLIDALTLDHLSGDDTMASHPGWSEVQAYQEFTRPGWGPLGVGGGLAQNSTPMSFTATATIKLAGFFVSSNPGKGTTSGILWATGLFSVTRTLVPGGNLTLTYTVQAAGGV